MTELEKILDIEEENDRYVMDLLRKMSDYTDVIIFGAGFGGADTLVFLQNETECGCRIKAFSDNNPEKIGTVYYGIPVISPHSISIEYKEALILISSTAFDSIKAQLISYGIAEENIYLFQPFGLSLSGEDKTFIKDHIEELSAVYEVLGDEESRIIYSGLLKYRICKRQEILENIKKYVLPECEQYFDKRILENYKMQTGFVDGGAYSGDTLMQFMRMFPSWGGKCFCFEADPEIANLLEAEVEKEKIKNVFVYRVALWNKKENLKFDVSSGGRGAGSKISDIGIDVNANTLDSICEDEQIDFIKLDIEGAEHNALEGAVQIIKENKPIMTICIYHKKEDFYDIPMLINSICPNEYEFYVRQYRYGQTETVLYALPKCRRI